MEDRKVGIPERGEFMPTTKGFKGRGPENMDERGTFTVPDASGRGAEQQGNINSFNKQSENQKSGRM